ncbi:MAG: VOC family protein [Turicibacter sp.]|nr:VOC family protein [Turicibacter sp.]
MCSHFTKIHHIAVIGSNYEASKHFYVDILGLPIIRENHRPKKGDIKLDLQMGAMELELFIKPDAPKRPGWPKVPKLPGFATCVFLRLASRKPLPI